MEQKIVKLVQRASVRICIRLSPFRNIFKISNEISLSISDSLIIMWYTYVPN